MVETGSLRHVKKTKRWQQTENISSFKVLLNEEDYILTYPSFYFFMCKIIQTKKYVVSPSRPVRAASEISQTQL